MDGGLHTAYMVYLWSFWITMPLATVAAFHQRSHALARIVAVMIVTELIMGVWYPMVEQSLFAGDPRWFGMIIYFLGGAAVIARPAGKLQSIMAGLFGIGMVLSILALTRDWTKTTDYEYTMGGVIVGLMMVGATLGAATGDTGKRICRHLWGVLADRFVAWRHSGVAQ